MKGNGAGDHHHKRHHQLEETRCQHAFLSLSKGLRAQGSLDDILIGAPVKQIGENHAGENGAKRGGVRRGADGVQLFRMLGQKARQSA